MPNRHPAVRLSLALVLGLAGCAPPGAEVPISEALRTAPPPQLGETASFDAALATAAPDAQRLASGSEALAARAAALRTRAAALTGEVVDPATRERLEAAPR